MWKNVKYREILSLKDVVRVKNTKHEAEISRVVDIDEFGQKMHALVYHIEPKDPNGFKGHWYFSHDLQKWGS